MRREQRGITFIGLVILIAFLGTFLYAGIRLIPVYLEYQQVLATLKQLTDQFQEGGATERNIRIAIERRFDVEDVKSLDYKDITVKRDGDVWDVQAAYSAVTPFIGNISFLVDFDKTVQVPAK